MSYYSVQLMAGVLLLTSLVAAADYAGDPNVGEQVYARCTGCHSLSVNRTGPRHCRLYNRKAATQPGFAYSEALKSAGLTWDVDTLDRFLKAPLKVVPGTIMGYVGIKDPVDRADLIAYLIEASQDEEQCPN